MTDIRRVAVVGAGVSGVAAALHLKRTGLDVTVYERGSRAGGVWVYDERKPKEPAFPSTLPSTGDPPEYEARQLKESLRHDSPLGTPRPEAIDDAADVSDLMVDFAPPGPCYIALKNNVSTIEMELTCQQWKPGTEEFVPHHVLGDYIQDTAKENGVLESISFGTRVDQIEKVGDKWRVAVSKLSEDSAEILGDVQAMHLSWQSAKHFDAVVIASGHYHAPNVPDLPGLAEWKEKFPGRLQHSKVYRRPEEFQDQNVLIIGAGVSSTDIARDLGPYAKAVFQSSRGGPYDLPSHLLPDNGARVSGIAGFGPVSPEFASDGSIPGIIDLQSGQKLCHIHRIIMATGYHVSFPFMRQYHADGVSPEDADESVLVTNGQVTHNLHKDIFYIQDPTLAFIGVPYHVATFSLFEFQAMALAQVFAGKVPLPATRTMRNEYNQRKFRKGAGRTLHSLKERDAEIEYVKELVEMVNAANREAKGLMTGHSTKWLEAYGRRAKRQQALFSQVRDPALNEGVLSQVSGCR
ncbi:Flavin-containing monooxygenase ustF2 [Pseudocercospora fuligena]|uniref:Flavin-containing monooxygenase ustF2 n=1 Tax=Pseudocercospora fuligena TaxID=685502 RepID=A0A8H6R726_9PEZI|nr:Flavin-containing monooxygenase ustF2 [Pseudocercospora fuligena]